MMHPMPVWHILTGAFSLQAMGGVGSLVAPLGVSAAGSPRALRAATRATRVVAHLAVEAMQALTQEAHQAQGAAALELAVCILCIPKP